MSNPSKAKGSKFAKDVAEFFAAHGQPYCERRVDGGSQDRGDLAGIPGWVVEVKNERALDLGTAMREAEREAKNAGARQFCAVLKRRNHGVASAYAVLPLWLLAELLEDT